MMEKLLLLLSIVKFRPIDMYYIAMYTIDILYLHVHAHFSE